MRTIDLSPLFRSSIGFDQLSRLAENAAGLNGDSTYPPYNIEKTGKDSYRLTMAVAGFAEADLDVSVNANRLVITGRKESSHADRSYLHRGIATRAFERKFDIADYIRVESASLENGLLHVDLLRELPEAMKPRKIAIAQGAAAKTIEQSIA